LIIPNAISAELKWKIDTSKGEQTAGSWVKTRRRYQACDHKQAVENFVKISRVIILRHSMMLQYTEDCHGCSGRETALNKVIIVMCIWYALDKVTHI
jgi:hypothetical protein